MRRLLLGGEQVRQHGLVAGRRLGIFGTVVTGELDQRTHVHPGKGAACADQRENAHHDEDQWPAPRPTLQGNGLILSVPFLFALWDRTLR